MSFDQKLAVWGIVLTVLFGVAGIGLAIFAVVDARRERTKREQAVIAARALIERNYGMLIALKPAIDEKFEAAVNDGLLAINAARTTLESL